MKLLDFFTGRRDRSDQNQIMLAVIQIKDMSTGEFVLKKAESPFFPKKWNDQEIMAAIHYVSTNGIQLGDGRWEGVYQDVRIVGRSNQSGEILQAYPQFGS